MQLKPLPQPKPPSTQVSKQVAFAPPSNDTHVPVTPRESAGQTPDPVQVLVQMRSPEPADWQVSPEGQSELVKQNS